MQLVIKAERFRRKWKYLLLLLITVASLWIGEFKRPLWAQSEPVEVANAWQHASFPVENFQGYTSPYGYRIHPTTGKRQFHRGLDIAAPIGSYVRNWWAGQIVSVSDNTPCGTTIKIQSGQWQHVYCHLDGHVETSANGRYVIDHDGGVQMWEGQQVPAGTRIGRIGMTGRTTGPHRHWGLMYAGNDVDPALVLQEMFTQQARS
ncbi:MAG: M23 family metallopeptidase [Cyanophyceae cyanobacterium]